MEVAVKELLRRVEDAYQRRDARAMAELYHPNAKHRLPSGGVAVGREEIRKHLPGIFEMTPEDIETETISQEIDLVTPDVAIIDNRVRNYRRTGDERSPVSVEGFTIVAIREAGKWLIAAVRGAFVPKEIG